jgi:CubicO group peptidase (beta-lactamase class C family)
VGDWPAGFAYTTVGDLARFAIALMNGGKIDGHQVLGTGLLETLSTRRVEVPFDWDLPKGFLEGAKYGHGFFIQEHRGLRILHHGGIIPGFGAFMVLVPEKQFAVIVMANKSGAVFGKTTEKAMELFLPLEPNRPVLPASTTTMTPAEMEEVTGSYRNGNLRIDLFVRDGKLMRKEFYKTSVEEGPGHEFEVPVEKIGRDRFVFAPPGSEAEKIQFTVIRSADGKPEYLHGNLEAAAKDQRSDK